MAAAGSASETAVTEGAERGGGGGDAGQQQPQQRVVVVRVRLPDGSTNTRRFLREAGMGVLYDWVQVGWCNV